MAISSLRGEQVPMMIVCPSAIFFSTCWLKIATSLVSSLSTTANLLEPKKCSLLISFNECTAISASPFDNASNISCVKKSVPSTVCKGISASASPRLLRAMICTFAPVIVASIFCFTFSSCSSDSRELRPMSLIVSIQYFIQTIC